MITEEQTQAVVRRIVEGYALNRITLFGSNTCGEPAEDSDRDLLISKENAAAKRVKRSVTAWQLLWRANVPPMNILIRTPAKMKKAAVIFKSVETIAQTQGRLLYAAW